MLIQDGFIKIGYYLNRENQFCLFSMTWSWKIGSNITRLDYFGIGENEFEKRFTAAGSVSDLAYIENYLSCCALGTSCVLWHGTKFDAKGCKESAK